MIAAGLLLWSSLASGRAMRDGFAAAEREREEIRSDVREGFDAAERRFDAAETDRAAIRADVRTILERLPSPDTSDADTSGAGVVRAAEPEVGESSTARPVTGEPVPVRSAPAGSPRQAHSDRSTVPH